MLHTTYRVRERGATALIIVMFFTLLLTVLAVGFIQTMVQEQKASQDSELSQGAYDSALAGAEDGKRALKACLNGDNSACAVIDARNCNTVSAVGLVPSGPDGAVLQSKVDAASSSTGEDYSQAYTCVVITRNTADVVGSLSADTSTIEPLKSVNNAPYDSLLVTWFKRSNSTSDIVSLDIPTDSSLDFTPAASWEKSRPPVLRVQLMQYAQGDLTVTDFNQTGGGSTIYLYPKSVGGLASFASDGRLDPTTGKKTGAPSVPYAAKCQSSFQNTVYACQATIQLPKPVRGDETNRVAFVRLTSLYNNADFSLQLLKAGNVVEFDGVQPKIDSTGKAADVYRRIVERVESTDASAALSLYPRATIDTTSSFCKDMSVTTQPAEYSNSCPTIP